jgi:hypothetical protein
MSALSPSSSVRPARPAGLHCRGLCVARCATRISKSISYTRFTQGDPIIGMPGSPFSGAMLGSLEDVSSAVQAFSAGAATSKPSHKIEAALEAQENAAQPVGPHCDFKWADVY